MAAPLMEARTGTGERAHAPAPALYPPPAAPRAAGTGQVHGHHGEIVQGVFYSSDGTLEHGLVTLPCTLFRATARFRPLRSAPLTVQPGGRPRARLAARLTLDALGYTRWGGALSLEGNVPLRWGCGSSTTDVLSTIRAVADAFGVVLEPAWIARLAVAAETASDSLMYGPERAVLFAQRRGGVLLDLGGPLPPVRVLGVNTEGGGVETLSLPPIPYSAWEVEAFQPILGLLRRAVDRQDPALLGRAATASALINQRHRPKHHLPQLLAVMRDTDALGVQVAHSGTVAGLLYEPGRPAADRMERARTALGRLGLDSWQFSTHHLAQPEPVS
ncbi:hypothetical protein [Longimicrobium sp.]|uniref:GHMP family kinase ATP-binding protein n=1 Tax=Longimicrobium sp. TaxID=2029185 RepID=UPI003B3A4016